MKQLVVLSGKGGTGKTCVTAAFAQLACSNHFSQQAVLADADVDAANLELLLKPKLLRQEDFKGGQLAVIDQETCASCGDCQAACRFEAIFKTEGRFGIDPIACEGCAACAYQCPTGSITMQEQTVGNFYRSVSRYGPLHHAHLFPGQENSGKLVTLVKQRARLQALDEHHQLVLVDGPPGIGCPVIAAISGADLVLIVSEPTLAGMHDLHRVLQTVQHFGVGALVCINKADLYSQGADQIEAYCRDSDIQTVGRIPFDITVANAMVQGEPITVFRPDSPSAMAISTIWDRVIESLFEGNP